MGFCSIFIYSRGDFWANPKIAKGYSLSVLHFYVALNVFMAPIKFMCFPYSSYATLAYQGDGKSRMYRKS